MYTLLGISLALAALLVINAFTSLMTVALWYGLARRRASQWSASSRARFLFALRLLPATCALFCVIALLSPSYIAHEPHTTTETISLELALLSLLSILGIGLALWRGLSAWRATRRLVAEWLATAEPITIEGINVPVYRIKHPFPVMALVGAFQPRLFIAGQILSSLSDEEVRAALAHEVGHLTARDNLKRALVRACSDVLAIVPAGRSLDRAWTESAEGAADEYVARHDGANGALNLAAALVRIARLAPAGAKPTIPAGAFLVGGNEGGVAWRIERLVQLAAVMDKRHLGPESLMLRSAPWLCLCGFLILATFIATNPRILLAMHTLMEHLVSVLQ